MKDATKLGGFAIIFIVILRLSIGWQFLYEGLWKCNSMQSSRPWTAAGYLQNAQGPYRDTFRDMTGDPDDLQWLDYDHMAAKWDAWHERFLAHHPDLTKKQKADLEIKLNGKKEYRSKLSKLPKEIRFGPTLGKVVYYDAQKKQLVAGGKTYSTPHLNAKEMGGLERMGRKSLKMHKDDKENTKLVKEYQAAIKRFKDLSKRFSYKEQLRASLKGDPERVTQVNKKYEGSIDGRRIGKIDRYKEMLKIYEVDLKKSKQDFEKDHLAYQQTLIRKMRSELVGPIKAMEASLKADAEKILTPEQFQRGATPAEPSQMRSVNNATIWGLLILGGMLLIGFGTRIAALGGAVMLLSFYLVMPPWPGVPPAPGPEHSLFVNKNLIEMLALIGIAFMPTGQWFGIDRWIYGGITRLWSKPEPDAQPVAPTSQKEQTPAKAAGKPDDKTYKLDDKKK